MRAGGGGGEQRLTKEGCAERSFNEWYHCSQVWGKAGQVGQGDNVHATTPPHSNLEAGRQVCRGASHREGATRVHPHSMSKIQNEFGQDLS